MKSAERRASARFRRFFANRGAVDRHSWKHAPALGFSHFLLKSQLPFLGLTVFRTPSGYAGADVADYGQPGSNGPHNMAWRDADGKTLYLTDEGGLYKVRVIVPGMRAQ